MEYNNRGIAYGKKGQLDAAIADFNKAIEIDPTFANAYYGRGIAYKNKGQFDLAIADLNSSIHLSQNPALTNGAKQALAELKK